MEIKEYHHKVQYYETDKMGIVHHSNYIRWMEEARTDMLNQMGCPYDQMEKDGFYSPVLSVSCQYREHVTYGDEVSIKVMIQKVSFVKFTVGYEMTNVENGHVVFNGSSEHCFLNRDLKLIRFHQALPEIYRKFKEMEQ